MIFDPAAGRLYNTFVSIITGFKLVGNYAIYRYRKAKRAAMSFATTDADFAAVRFDDGLGDIEPEAGARDVLT